MKACTCNEVDFYCSIGSKIVILTANNWSKANNWSNRITTLSVVLSFKSTLIIDAKIPKANAPHD